MCPLAVLTMVYTAAAAAQASSMWMSRRVRVASQQISTSNNHNHENNNRPVMRFPPTQARFSRPTNAVPTVSPSPTLPSQWLAPAFPPKQKIDDITESISARIREKYINNSDLMNHHLAALNADVFWTQYSSLHDLSRVDSKSDILRIISTFQFISKKSIFLFSNFARKVIANVTLYSAGDLASIVSAFAQLGFLEESFCMQIAHRVMEDAKSATANELVSLIDGYASTRCYHSAVIDTLVREAKSKINSFTVEQVSLFSSSLARLNVRDEAVFDLLSKRLLFLTADIIQPRPEIFSIPEDSPVEVTAEPHGVCTARDVTLAAYAFAKMRIPTTPQFESKIVQLAKSMIRDFTAKELQMLTTALDRWSRADAHMYAEISTQAQRRIAQFSGESLVLLLRALISRNHKDDSLATRVVCQLPRLAANLKASELVQFFSVLKDMGVKSEAGLEAIRAVTVSKAGQFSPADWITLIGSVVEIASPDLVSEMVEGFVLVNASPAKYRDTLSAVDTTVIQRMSNSQIVSLVTAVSGMTARTPKLMGLIADNVRGRKFNSHDSSDLYCVLVKMDCHKEKQFESVMKDLFTNALAF